MAKKQFKAESQRLLDLMINSIYTHQEIFLREIISNASDAIDKLAYRALTDENVGLNRGDFAITITRDPENRILTISDNGIGMDYDELEKNLGTICRSGSLQFKNEAEKKDDIDIIGQFGVGFYSAFMVAQTVTVVSRKYGSDQAFMWQSNGADGYTIQEAKRDQPGTDVIMKLKDDSDDGNYSKFLDQEQIKSLIKKYSDYVRYPIKMEVTQQRLKEGTEKSEKPEWETFTEVATLNSMVPIWQRPKKDVTDDEYTNFYRDKFGDYMPPLTHVYVSVEGAVTYKALLYIPSQAPYDFYTRDFKAGLQLYSSGVMIMEHCEDLLPEHFRFVRGVVDSQDLSLNISREMLQHDRQLKIISNNLDKKLRAELTRLLTEEREKYETFWTAFGRQIKCGAVADYGANKEMLQDLLLFWADGEGKLETLKEYVAAMPEGQEKIYYAAGESRDRLMQLPQVERLQDKGYDVLFMTEDVDEFVPRTLQNYDGKAFCNITTDDLDLDTEEEKKAAEEQKKDLEPVLDYLKKQLEGRIKEVRLSQNLGSHPVCLVPAGGMSFEMEKYFKRMNPDMPMMDAGRILEINPAHSAVAALQSAIGQDEEKAAKYAEVLYAQALLMADLPLEDPTAYTDLVCSLMQ